MKKLFGKNTIAFFVFGFASFFCFGQNNAHVDGTVLYQDAITAFENGDYGKALKLSEDAVLTRKQHITYEIDVLNTALQPRQVQKAGDGITDILKVLNERDEYDAIKIINFYIKKKGEKYFENSISKLLSYLESIKVFPEAQKLIGDVYKIEGEYDFAESYYRDALKNVAVLDVPDQRYEILYLLADISELKNDEQKREERLLNILTEDEKNYKNTALVNAMVRTIRTNKKDSLEKFFNLYRADGFYMLKAYHELAVYYYEKGDLEKALGFAALDSITCFTRIIDVVKVQNINFKYEGLESVLKEAALNDDLLKWGKENNIWGCFNFLAEVAKADGKTTFAHNLLKVISECLPDEYYQKQAIFALRAF